MEEEERIRHGTNHPESTPNCRVRKESPEEEIHNTADHQNEEADQQQNQKSPMILRLHKTGSEDRAMAEVVEEGADEACRGDY